MAAGFLGFSNSKSNDAWSFGGTSSSTHSPQLTETQLLSLILERKKHKNESLWGSIKHAGSSAFHPVTWTFDKLLRPTYGYATALDYALGHRGSGFKGLEGAAEAYGHGFMGNGDKSVGEALSKHGIWDNHKIFRGAAGLGADIASDPLSYISGGTGGLAAKGVEHATAIAAGRRAIMGATREELGTGLEGFTKTKIEDIGHLSSAGENYKFRKALAQEQLRHLNKISNREVIGAKDTATLHIAQESALAEERRFERRLPQLSIGVGNKRLPITPTKIGGRQVVPTIPSMRDLALEHKIPGVSAALTKVGDHFVPGFRNPELHAGEITQKHLAEQINSELLHTVHQMYEDVPKLSRHEQLKALHYFERPKDGTRAVLKTKNGKYALNEGYISKLQGAGKLTPAQVKFVRFMHSAGNMLYQHDRQFGHIYDHAGERGVMYVPHIVDRSGHPLSDAQKSLLTKAGFEKSRGTENFSVLQLSKKFMEGETGKGIESDPFKLLVHRVRGSANRASDLARLHMLAQGVGKATRQVDTAALHKTHEAVEGIRQLQEEHFAAAHDAEQKFLADHEDAHNAKIAALTRKFNKHKFGKNTGTKKANMANAAKQILKVHNAHAAEVKAIADGTHAGLAKHLAPFHAQTAALDKEVANLGKVEKVLLKGRPLRPGKHLTTVAGAVDKHGHPLAFEPDVAHSITRAQKIITGDDKTVNDFSKGWSKWLANWKLLVTSVNPGYRVRNTMSDVWAMYVSGMPMHAVGTYGGKAAKMMVAAKKGDPKAVAKLVEAYHHGILSGLYAGDVQSIAKMIEFHGSKQALIKRGRFIKLSTKVAQDMNRNAENWGRLAHYLYLRDGQGMGVADAAFRVKRAHFDYEDLTPFEQRRMKVVAPFYTWIRKNVPFQLRAMAERPGKYLAFPKIAAESENAAGGDQGNILPSYLSEGFAFQIPFGKHNYYTPQIGASDLQLFNSKKGATGRLLGLLNPAVKTPAELLLNKSFFTGQPIAGPHPRNPVSKLGAGLLGMIPGTDVGQTSRQGPDGKTLTGPGANPYAAYMLQQLPLLGELGLKSSGIKRGQSGVAFGPELSYVGGQSVQHVDPQMQLMSSEIGLQDETTKYLKGLRDEGSIARPHKKKKSENQRLIDKYIRIYEGS